VGDRWYAVRLKSRNETPRDEFEKNKEQIKKALLPQKQEETLAAWLKDTRDKSKIELNQMLVTEK
jgi:peptidyl-prolyl cis-trans isomerase D